jgi:hypothetical protein
VYPSVRNNRAVNAAAIDIVYGRRGGADSPAPGNSKETTSLPLATASASGAMSSIRAQMPFNISNGVAPSGPDQIATRTRCPNTSTNRILGRPARPCGGGTDEFIETRAHFLCWLTRACTLLRHELAGDDQALDLVGALEDLGDLGFAP